MPRWSLLSSRFRMYKGVDSISYIYFAYEFNQINSGSEFRKYLISCLLKVLNLDYKPKMK